MCGHHFRMAPVFCGSNSDNLCSIPSPPQGTCSGSRGRRGRTATRRAGRGSASGGGPVSRPRTEGRSVPRRGTLPTRRTANARRDLAVVSTPIHTTKSSAQAQVVMCISILGIHWTAWGPWTPCSVSCGLGTMTKTRSCVDEADVISKPTPGVDCLGPETREDECEPGPCPGDRTSDTAVFTI